MQATAGAVGQRKRRWTGSLALGLLCTAFLTAGACRSASAADPLGPTGQATRADPGGSIRDFHLTAVSAVIELGPGVKVHAWTYNGTVPGPAIRATVGDLVRVRLTNRLSEGTSINWHGLRVPNGEDGVAGVTQDPCAVNPGPSTQIGPVGLLSRQDRADLKGR